MHHHQPPGKEERDLEVQAEAARRLIGGDIKCWCDARLPPGFALRHIYTNNGVFRIGWVFFLPCTQMEFGLVNFNSSNFIENVAS